MAVPPVLEVWELGIAVHRNLSCVLGCTFAGERIECFNDYVVI